MRDRSLIGQKLERTVNLNSCFSMKIRKRMQWVIREKKLKLPGADTCLRWISASQSQSE